MYELSELRSASYFIAAGLEWLLNNWAEFRQTEIHEHSAMGISYSTLQETLNKTRISRSFGIQFSPNFHRLRKKYSRIFCNFFLPRTSIFPWFYHQFCAELTEKGVLSCCHHCTLCIYSINVTSRRAGRGGTLVMADRAGGSGQCAGTWWPGTLTHHSDINNS